MALRKLTEIEKSRVKRLTSASVQITLLQPTATGLRKSIMDATAPIRNFLKEKGLHDFEFQRRGAKYHGVKLDAILLSEKESTKTKASLYKPEAKPNSGGDPRIWFYKLAEYAQSDDMLAVSEYHGSLAVINLTRIDIAYVLDILQAGSLWDFLQSVSEGASNVADELLGKLQDLAMRGFVASVMAEKADTAVGRTLEHELGIAINSAKEPDYKGIELKSFRSRKRSKENSKTLFAQVPNWKLSKFKSSREILENFGYWRNQDFKLYCTVSTQSVNSQGLYLEVDDHLNVINEKSNKAEIGEFATWLLSDLRKALVAKHSETFWVRANVKSINSREHFLFFEVRHTRKPVVTLFDILVEQGEVTVDHLIKRNSKNKVSEKGPLFKINSGSLELLFPSSKTHHLI